MKSLVPVSSLVLSVAALLAGCESTGGVSNRIQEKSALYSSLPADQQAALKAGAIDVGYTQEMAYIALGNPTKKQTEGDNEIWTYNKYYGFQGSNSGPMLNGPQNRYQSSVISHNMKGQTKGDSGGSLGSTTGGAQTSLDVPDMQAQTLTVYFVKGRVVNADMKPER